jgi:nucleotide-binding universal stress UspA family protein
MYQHILLATDGSELASKAVAHGLDLAKTLGAEVTIITVSEPMWSADSAEMAIAFPHEEYEKSAAAAANTVLLEATKVAKEKGISCASRHVKNQFPAEGIVATAKEEGCDLIIMASHGRRGLAKLILGSQASRVIVTSPVPVLIFRN